MRRVFYRSTGLDEWVDIAAELESRHQWAPVYWLTPRGEGETARKRFPDATIQNIRNANQVGLPEDSATTEYRPLDSDSLDTYRKYRPDALRLMDRLDPGHSFSYDERVRHYHKQLRYWSRVVECHEIDTAVIGSWPHVLSEYVAYIVCRENDLDVAYVNFSLLPEYCHVRRDVGGVNESLNDLYNDEDRDLDPDAISTSTREHIDALAGESASTTNGERTRPISTNFLTRAVNPTNWPGFVSSLTKRTWRDVKVRDRPIESSEITLVRKWLYKAKEKRYKSRLRRRYDEFSGPPDFSRKYVYVPLHFETEVSTVPLGGDFRSQFLAVDLLSKCIPDSWHIYVKEHPSQFTRTKINRGRNVYDYADMVSLPNVHLVDVETSTYDLIDHSMATATVTGTAGWEAVLRGIPAINFGNSRYRLCEGVYHVTTRDDVREVVNTIREDGAVEKADVLRFVRALELDGYRGYNTPARRENSPLSPEENLANTVNAIVEFLDD